MKISCQLSYMPCTGNPDLFLLDISRFRQQWRHSRTCHSPSQGRRTWPNYTLPSTKTCQLRRGRVGTTMPHRAGLLSSWSISGGVFPRRSSSFRALPCGAGRRLSLTSGVQSRGSAVTMPWRVSGTSEGFEPCCVNQLLLFL